jgi:hypothetical protein
MSWRGNGAFGLGVLLPLLLVCGLMVFNTVDADGDPLTANGPPVVLVTEWPGATAREDDLDRTELEPEPGVGARRRLTRSASSRLRRVRSAWLARTRPIRGP